MGYLALDLGASGGTAILGEFDEEKLRLKEVHRFDNSPLESGDKLEWDFDNLMHQIKIAIKKAYQANPNIKGIAVDTWGVDFGLLDKQGRLITNPRCYRDSYTEGYTNKLSKVIDSQRFYSLTGIQQMNINTVYQLKSLAVNEPQLLKQAKHLLFMPDLIHYYLSGEMATEYTIASTSQLLNAETKDWEKSLFDELDLPYQLMQPVVAPGTRLATLSEEVAKELAVPQIPIYLIGSHDTASAIGAIPSREDNTAFLSSGTWSLLGITTPKPILTKEALKANFTNEGGIDNKILFMRNITGLWILQSLIREWQEQGDKETSYDVLLKASAEAPPFRSFIDSDHPSFSYPESMTKAIQEFCKESNQPIPQSKGELVRAVLESLAIKYALVFKELESCSGKKLNSLQVVGGGSLNKQLNQFIANALQLPIVTGVIEATAIGNIIKQAIASKEINWSQADAIINKSFEFNTYKPQEGREWMQAIERAQQYYN